MARRREGLAAVDYRTLAELRYHTRRFLRAREIAARPEGVAPQHYLLLLQVKGLEGRTAHGGPTPSRPDRRGATPRAASTARRLGPTRGA